MTSAQPTRGSVIFQAAHFTKNIGKTVLRKVWVPGTDSMARELHTTLGINSEHLLDKVNAKLSQIKFQLEDSTETLLYHCENYVNPYATGYTVTNCILVTNYRVVKVEKAEVVKTVYFSQLDPNSAIEHKEELLRWDKVGFKMQDEQMLWMGVYERKKAAFLRTKLNQLLQQQRNYNEFWDDVFVTKEGLLEKEGSSNKTWKKRYFRLTDHRLSYYSDVTNPEALSHLSLMDACCETVDKKNFHLFLSDGKPVFKLTTQQPHRELFLSGGSVEENEKWINAIINNLQWRKLVEAKMKQACNQLEDEVHQHNDKIAILEQQLLSVVSEEKFKDKINEMEEQRKSYENKISALSQGGGEDNLASVQTSTTSTTSLLLEQERLKREELEKETLKQKKIIESMEAQLIKLTNAVAEKDEKQVAKQQPAAAPVAIAQPEQKTDEAKVVERLKAEKKLLVKEVKRLQKLLK